MKWLVQGKDPKQKQPVELPDRLVSDQPFDAKVDGKTVRCCWNRSSKTLYVIDEKGAESPLWTRASRVTRHPQEPDVQVELEVMAGVHLCQGIQRQIVRDVPGQESRAQAQAQKGNVVRSPMTGKVLQVPVNEGEKVDGQTVVCVIEAMKMENKIFAPGSGVIGSIKVQKGSAVSAGDELLSLK